MDKRFYLIFLLIAVLLALVISPFASSFPDGLERVAEDRGFLEKGEVEPAVKSPIPDYLMPGIKDERLATSIAGVIGTLLVFGVTYGLAAVIGAKRKQKEAKNAP